MRITLYSHSSKESNYDAGKKAGLSDAALKTFLFAGYEHKMEYEVDPNTGVATLVSVDGKELK